MIFVPLIPSFSNFSTAPVDKKTKLAQNLTYDDLSGRLLSYLGLTTPPIHLSNFL